jgi:hypothetical protein
MTERGYWHQIHGKALHDEVISRLQRYVILHHGKLLSCDGFMDKYHCPCKPDVFCSYEGNGRPKELFVFEVETNASKRSRDTKWQQYKESTAGIKDAVILDLNDLIAQNSWIAIDAFIDEQVMGRLG